MSTRKMNVRKPRKSINMDRAGDFRYTKFQTNKFEISFRSLLVEKEEGYEYRRFYRISEGGA